MKWTEPMPEVYQQFSRWFHQDILLIYPSLDQAASGFIAELDAVRSAELNAHLGKLLASDSSDEELQELWSECGSEWGVSPIRPFLERVRAQLAVGGEPM